jgi:hypothetical protein
MAAGEEEKQPGCGIDESYKAITENATGKLFGHILMKGLQAGSLLGLAIALPLAVRHHAFRRSSSPFLPSALKVIERSAGAGVLLSGKSPAFMNCSRLLFCSEE